MVRLKSWICIPSADKCTIFLCFTSQYFIVLLHRPGQFQKPHLNQTGIVVLKKMKRKVPWSSPVLEESSCPPVWDLGSWLVLAFSNLCNTCYFFAFHPSFSSRDGEQRCPAEGQALDKLWQLPIMLISSGFWLFAFPYRTLLQSLVLHCDLWYSISSSCFFVCTVTSTLTVKTELLSFGNESLGDLKVSERSVEEKVPRIGLRKEKTKQLALLKYQAWTVWGLLSP